MAKNQFYDSKPRSNRIEGIYDIFEDKTPEPETKTFVQGEGYQVVDAFMTRVPNHSRDATTINLANELGVKDVKELL